ncbi:12805_t:CDS:2 [Gigaspora margarita]|uniref:12805_t:CDS:1 n=1 Tax=Gigaspora margarita TaxID=4874 RepID=A0ABN7VPA9_GIGMA|nr:12805_t:CDS:2 [Gigaspora margarita]
MDRLYSINAMCSLNSNENEMVPNLRAFLDVINLSPVYKQLIMRLLNNDHSHSMFQILPNIDNKNLLICLNWECLKCKTTINHKAAAGQTRLNQTKVQNAINNSDKTGYVMEAGSLEQYKITFLKNIFDPNAHCMDHITKDWDVLKSLLNCNDEDLALILHYILHSIVKSNQIPNAILTTKET